MAKFNQQKALASVIRSRQDATPLAKILSAEQITDDVVKVTVMSKYQLNEPQAVSNIMAEVSSLVDNKMSIIQDSMYVKEVSALGHTEFDAYMRVNEEKRVFTPSEFSTAGFKQVSSHVLMNEEDQTIWSMAEVDGNIVITLDQHSDLSDMMQHASVDLNIATTDGTPVECAAFEPANMQNSSYVMFINPQTSVVDFGYNLGCGLNKIYSSDSMSVVSSVDPRLILVEQSLGGSDLLDTVDVASVQCHEDQIDAYNTMYKQNADYYCNLDASAMTFLSQGADGHEA